MSKKRKLPESIKIGAIRYDVKKVADLHDFDSDWKKVHLNGHIIFNSCEILIKEGLDPQVENVVLWHEVIHGILSNAGINDESEQTIEVLGYGIADALISNPELLKLMKNQRDGA